MKKKSGKKKEEKKKNNKREEEFDKLMKKKWKTIKCSFLKNSTKSKKAYTEFKNKNKSK